ncbi:MAG TPA: tripartite tricarboxylate transporter substrate binding protein [Burkholderiales bacterium]|nr:tripartite tricarboxylate transporter substrate binding protein [Burkholderiales bacterium]
MALRYPHVVLALLAFLAASAHAQPYPAKPLRLVVPFAAGGGSDLVARTVAQKLTEALGQPVVVDNRAGAAGTIGAEIVAKSPPDGHTLLMGSSGPLAINPSLYAKLPYDAARDFAPVALVTVMPFMIVTHPSLPAQSVKELVALARSRPGELNYGSPGNGSTTHLATELLKAMTGIRITHVPYKGVAPAATDLISGQVQVLTGDLSTLLPHVRSGRMRGIAVTSLRRSSLLPGMPTVAESGVAGYDATGWFGVLVPAATPAPVVERLNAAIVKGASSPDARERLAALGGEVASGSPAEFAAYVRSEAAKWGKVIRTIGVKAEG